MHCRHRRNERRSGQAVIVGSLRRQSWSRKLAEEIIRRAGGKLSCTILQIGDLPLYNEDLDEHPPASWQRLRDEIDAAEETGKLLDSFVAGFTNWISRAGG